jgi:hypothetical protein
MGPPEALSVTDGLYSFVVKLNEPPAGHWIYAFKLAKAAGDIGGARHTTPPACVNTPRAGSFPLTDQGRDKGPRPAYHRSRLGRNAPVAPR